MTAFVTIYLRFLFQYAQVQHEHLTGYVSTKEMEGRSDSNVMFDETSTPSVMACESGSAGDPVALGDGVEESSGMLDLPFELYNIQSMNIDDVSNGEMRCKDDNGEMNLSEFADNDSSKAQIEGLVRELPPCYLDIPMPLAELYEEAVGVTTFQDVLRKASEEYAVGNVQQRALTSASIPGTRRLDYDVIMANNERFSADPSNFIQSMNEAAAPRRLNTERILEAFPYANEFPEWDRLCELAKGVCPPLEDSFVPSMEAAKVRTAMNKIQPALDVLANVLVERQEGFVISADVFRGTIKDHELEGHLSEIHHIGKPYFDLGRLLFDYTNLEGATPINSPLLKPKLIEKFGALRMPTLASLYVMAEEMQLIFPKDIINLRKSDVARAFQRMIWSTRASLLMAVLLSSDHVLVPTSMGFGSSAGPYGYGPITRFFEFMHKRIVRNLCIQHPLTKSYIDTLGIIYCDDSLDVGPKSLLEVVGAQSSHVVRVTLGDDAVNDFKDKITTKDTTLGVLSDFETKMAAPGWRAYLKLVYVFFKLLPLSVLPTTKVSLRLLQALGQLSLRYAVYIPVVRSTASSFFAAIRSGRGTHRCLSQRQIDDIFLWRSVLVSAVTHSKLLQTSFSAVISLSKEYRHLAYIRANGVAYSDASGREVTSESVIIREAIGVYVPGRGYLFWEWPLDTVPIACIELLASIIAYLLTNYLLPNVTHCHLYIDNQNAISWSMGKIKTEDTFARNLCCLNSLLQGGWRGCFQSREYIRSKDNRVADAISRRNLDLPELQNIPRYQLEESLINYFLELSKSCESRPLEMLLTQRMMSDLTSSAHFSLWQE